MAINKRSSLESVLKVTQKTIGSKVLVTMSAAKVHVAERSRKHGNRLIFLLMASTNTRANACVFKRCIYKYVCYV